MTQFNISRGEPVDNKVCVRDLFDGDDSIAAFVSIYGNDDELRFAIKLDDNDYREIVLSYDGSQCLYAIDAAIRVIPISRVTISYSV